VGCAGQERSTRLYEKNRDAQIAALMARGTAESLATASLMVYYKRDVNDPYAAKNNSKASNQ
jgi:hypothetical protein